MKSVERHEARHHRRSSSSCNSKSPIRGSSQRSSDEEVGNALLERFFRPLTGEVASALFPQWAEPLTLFWGILCCEVLPMQANTPWEMLPSRQRTRSAPRNSTRFAAQYSARGLPCERFTAVLTDRTSCITRGRGGWLDLPRGGLAPPILCQLAWRTPLRVIFGPPRSPVRCPLLLRQRTLAAKPLRSALGQ